MRKKRIRLEMDLVGHTLHSDGVWEDILGSRRIWKGQEANEGDVYTS
jgi:hypothetical protein